MCRRIGTTRAVRRFVVFYTFIFAGVAVLLVVAVIVQQSRKK